MGGYKLERFVKRLVPAPLLANSKPGPGLWQKPSAPCTPPFRDMSLVLEAAEVLGRPYDGYAAQCKRTLGPVRVAPANRANRLTAARSMYSGVDEMTGPRTGGGRNPGRPATLTRQPCVSFQLWASSAKPLYAYSPARIASMRADGEVGPLMADVFSAMRSRETVLGRVALPEAVRARRTRIVEMVEATYEEDIFNIPPNAFHLAVEYANRFLAAPVPPPRAHSDRAIALACWFMATKFESRIRHPYGRDLVRASGRGTGVNALLAAEMDVCVAIDYQLSVVTPQLFLEWFVLAFSIAPSVANTARCFVRRAMHRFDGTAHYPSEVAIAALEAAAGRRAGPSYGQTLGECLAKYADVDVSAVRAVTAAYEQDTAAE